MATQFKQDILPTPFDRPAILTLEQSLSLDVSEANRLYARHLNRHLLGLYGILGLDDLDVRAARGTVLHLANGREVLDFSTIITPASWPQSSCVMPGRCWT